MASDIRIRSVFYRGNRETLDDEEDWIACTRSESIGSGSIVSVVDFGTREGYCCEFGAHQGYYYLEGSAFD
jgi:hypothetical protein